MTYRTDETDEIADQVRNEVSLLVLTCYRPNDSRPFDRLRDLRLSLRGAAAVIGRGVESTGVFGWVTGDRLRQVWLILIIKLLGGGRASDLTTD